MKNRKKSEEDDIIVRIIDSKNEHVKLHSIDMDIFCERVCNCHMLKQYFGNRVRYDDGKLIIKDCNKSTESFVGADDRLIDLFYSFLYTIGSDNDSDRIEDEKENNKTHNKKVLPSERLRTISEVFTGEFTAGDYCKKYLVSKATASTDISTLIDHNQIILVRHDKRKVYRAVGEKEQRRLDSFEESDQKNKVTTDLQL